jgi:hypothetical protein
MGMACSAGAWREGGKRGTDRTGSEKVAVGGGSRWVATQETRWRVGAEREMRPFFFFSFSGRENEREQQAVGFSKRMMAGSAPAALLPQEASQRREAKRRTPLLLLLILRLIMIVVEKAHGREGSWSTSDASSSFILLSQLKSGFPALDCDLASVHNTRLAGQEPDRDRWRRSLLVGR